MNNRGTFGKWGVSRVMENSGAELEICMLGGFTIYYKGHPISFSKGGRFKSIQLLQILLIHMKTGISKEELFQHLYDWEVITDRNNSLNSLIYRLKKQLVAAGLPKEEYICLKNGICYWCSKIETWVDSVAMEELIDKARKSGDEEKEKLLREACDLYQGEFLPENANEMWVAVENARLKALYEKAVLELCEIWKNQGEYQQMLELYTRIAGFYPFEEWQVYQIDCLLEMGQHEKAYEIYQQTVKAYSDELGVPPSPRMVKRFQRMNGKLINKENSLLKVKEQLNEEKESAGAYYCPYPSFIDTYRFVCRILERSGQSLFLMLCGLWYDDPLERRDKDDIDSLLAVIEETLRRGDVFTKYSSSQCLILLSGTHSEDCEIIIERIRRRFREAYPYITCQIEYEIVEIIELAGKIHNMHF